MQFEDFDRKIRDAATNHHPLYDEKAWSRMEKKLDEHLPQKRDRRKLVFYILIPVAIACSFLIYSSLQERIQISPDPGLVHESHKTGNSSFENYRSLTQSGQPLPGKSSKHLVNIPQTNNIRRRNDYLINDVSKRSFISGNVEFEVRNGNVASRTYQPKLADVTAPADKKQFTNPDDNIMESPSYKHENSDENMKKGNTDKPRNFLFATLAAGPDISSVGNQKGETRLMGGLGIGYSIRDRFNIRTGFYTSRKVYSAPSSYYKPGVPPPNAVYLDHIDADCRVYEIPVSLSWNFLRKGNTSLFVGAGVSSYIMKEEKYNYVYKYPSGTTYEHTWDFRNENSHLFSVAHISAGIERKIGKRLSVMAEPYLRLPMSGIGHGNMKLKNAGVMLSANLRLHR